MKNTMPTLKADSLALTRTLGLLGTSSVWGIISSSCGYNPLFKVFWKAHVLGPCVCVCMCFEE